MRMRYLAIASLALAAAFMLIAIAPQDGVAANMSPAQIGKMQSGRILEPAHCRAVRHCHRRCRSGRCWNYCHRCG